jgi:hypothetical protein
VSHLVAVRKDGGDGKEDLVVLGELCARRRRIRRQRRVHLDKVEDDLSTVDAPVCVDVRHDGVVGVREAAVVDGDAEVLQSRKLT